MDCYVKRKTKTFDQGDDTAGELLSHNGIAFPVAESFARLDDLGALFDANSADDGSTFLLSLQASPTSILSSLVEPKIGIVGATLLPIPFDPSVNGRSGDTHLGVTGMEDGQAVGNILRSPTYFELLLDETEELLVLQSPGLLGIFPSLDRFVLSEDRHIDAARGVSLDFSGNGALIESDSVCDFAQRFAISLQEGDDFSVSAGKMSCWHREHPCLRLIVWSQPIYQTSLAMPLLWVARVALQIFGQDPILETPFST
jgi:hypothetical protein